MRFRAAIGRLCAWALVAALSIESVFVSAGRTDPWGREIHRPNGRLLLASVRDLRSPASARNADSIESSRWALYFTGVRVVVDTTVEPMTLLRPSGSAVDTLTWIERRRHLVESGRWGCSGPVLGLFLD